MSERKLWSLTTRKYNALFRVWQAERDYQDLQTALIRLDIHNAWFVSKEHHPDGWTLDELLPKRMRQEQSYGNSPEAEAWYRKFKVQASLAMASGRWDGPDIFPLPS